jgi:hypothetical protein
MWELKIGTPDTNIKIFQNQSTLEESETYISQEHDQSVNSHTPASRRWETILERLAEGFVDKLCLIISLSFLATLFPLILR